MSKSNYSSTNGNFICRDYLLLKPHEATFSSLFHLLWSKDKHKHRFIETPSELAEEFRDFRYRWLVFISTLAQKLLQHIRNPKARVGFVLDLWLNLISNNGGLFKLFINFIRGKVEKPNELKENYRSFIGSLDRRIDLDPKIQTGDPKYTPGLALMAAKLSYENHASIKYVVEQHWKMELLGSYDFWNGFQGKNSTRGFISRNVTEGTDTTVVAFSGTQPFNADDWCTDFDLSWYELSGVGRVHSGFLKALGLQNVGNAGAGWPKEVDLSPGEPIFAYYTIRKVLRQICEENKNAKFIITGHSLGGALAILFTSLLILHEEKEMLDRLEGVYTFGQPRVGDGQFGQFMKKKLVSYNVTYSRYVYCNDLVPRLPYDDKSITFKHFGPCLYFDSLYNAKVLEEEPNRNYFSLMWAIPKYMNAWWEFIRGFIFPLFVWGPDYKESWTERTFRLIGFLIPGLSAHGPQDYNNLTRLGHLPLPQKPIDKSN